MSMKISQSTFDEAVEDNAELLSLSDIEALRETIDQFRKQGVNLSNIDLTGGVGRQEMFNLLKSLQDQTITTNSDQLCAILTEISASCNKLNELFVRNQMLMRENGGLNSLHLLFDTKYDSTILLKVMELLNDLSKADDDSRDFFEPGGSVRLCNVLKQAVSEGNNTVIVSALTLARTVNKSENNKNMLMKAGVGELLVSLLVDRVASGYGSSNVGDEITNNVLQEACQLVRGLCVHDDYRKDMSCAYDNGKYFIKQTNFVQTLTTLAAGFRAQPGVASAALHATRNLITTEESVQVVSQYGAIELITDILSCEGSSLSLVRSAVALMRNVCADDVRKDKLVGDGTLNLLLCAMSKEMYASDANFAEHALACLAAMSLRSPSNSERIVQHGQALDILVRTMRRHGDRAALQRQGCLAVRNIAARCPELRLQLLDAGLEPVLRAAGRLSGVVDEAYAALRDLECDVHFVKISEDGTVAPAYEQFGATSSTGAPRKLQFNPIYDEDSSHIEQRVQEEARAPLQPENLRHDHADTDHVFSAVNSADKTSKENNCCGQSHDHDHGHEH